MAPEKTRKVRDKVTPYTRKPGLAVDKDRPKTSAKPAKNKSTRENLTLSDWLTVFEFIDNHPSHSQGEVVRHFSERVDGALIFKQSTLSRKIKMRATLEERAKSTPTALSSKRARVVTRPDVERALILWVRHMEERKETVSGPMLREKRKRFEELLQVPETERLPGDGWVAPFCKAYKIKEFRRHGEAASVDLAAVEAERKRVRELMKKYAPRNRWNFDESSLFPMAPPDRGLATKQVAGKKKEKFRITLGFACNADGSEKLPLMYIGKAKKPRCFGKETPEQRGFYYRNNKKAWMTSVLFEEFIKKLDIKMRTEGRHILLTIDNFSGHSIEYDPTNIEIAFFEPNLTSFVQPLDAGIIRCFKAHYRTSLCKRAIDLDEEGEREIYKINILEGMLLAEDAWKAVSAETIKHCWDHTKIQLEPVSEMVDVEPLSDPGAWDILRKFASSDMTLPEAEESLIKHLGDRFKDNDWRPALKAIMDAEGDVPSAQLAVQRFSVKCSQPKLTIKVPATRPPQIVAIEKELIATVEHLQKRNRIFGVLPTLEELLNPAEENAQLEDSPHSFPGGDLEIAKQARYEIQVETQEVIEVDDSDSEDDDDPVANVTRGDAIKLCEQLEQLTIRFGRSHDLSLAQNLRQFRAQLRREKVQTLKQVHIGEYFVEKATLM